MGQNYVDICFGNPAGVNAADDATLPSVEQPDLSAADGQAGQRGHRGGKPDEELQRGAD